MYNILTGTNDNGCVLALALKFSSVNTEGMKAVVHHSRHLVF